MDAAEGINGRVGRLRFYSSLVSSLAQYLSTRYNSAVIRSLFHDDAIADV